MLDWTHPLVLMVQLLKRLVQYPENSLLYWVPSHVRIRGNEKAHAEVKSGLLRSYRHLNSI